MKGIDFKIWYFIQIDFEFRFISHKFYYRIHMTNLENRKFNEKILNKILFFNKKKTNEKEWEQLLFLLLINGQLFFISSCALLWTYHYLQKSKKLSEPRQQSSFSILVRKRSQKFNSMQSLDCSTIEKKDEENLNREKYKRLRSRIFFSSYYFRLMLKTFFFKKSFNAHKKN